MDWIKVLRRILCICFLLIMQGVQLAYAHSLNLHQAEKAALTQSPELKALDAKSQAFKQSAIAAGQLSDPKLILGAINMPVDTFNFSQEAMTQVQVGIQQAFPRGHSLRYRSLQKKEMSFAEKEKRQVIRAQILRGVRNSWITLYYWPHARDIVMEQKKVFRYLVKVTESMLANNKAQQKDVIRAQLELSELDNRLIEIDQEIDTARAQLARWIGASLAKKARPSRLPNWRNPPSLRNLEQIIKHHPELCTDQRLIAVNHMKVKLAAQQYKPGFNVGLAYGFRQGENFDRSKRADFLTAQVSIDLPLFTHNRQDRTLKASEENLLASKENQMSHYRQLRETLQTQYAAWRQLRKTILLYRQQLMPKAKQYAEATMTTYQNAQTDFPTLARAYIRELKTRLDELKTVVNSKKARVNLLYLEGK